MTKTTSAVQAFVGSYDRDVLTAPDLEQAALTMSSSQPFKELLLVLIRCGAFDEALGQEFAAANAIEGLAACRRLRSCLGGSLGSFVGLLSELLSAFDAEAGQAWSAFAKRVCQSELGETKLMSLLKRSADGEFFSALAEELVANDPHAIYPTSSYRSGSAYVVSTDDDQNIEAVMNSSTFTSVKVVENSLDPSETTLSDLYAAHGRCVALVDRNVEEYYGTQLEQYFAHHGIKLDKLVYRAMEVDKGIHTVERMLGDFKRLGVSRNEPVLIAGGGVLADTGGLACSLYHRNTPYVMLSTSIVAGIDAGPSPRTCCDGFGYKNLFGAYHAPVVSITDRFFFKSLDRKSVV